MEEKYIKKWLRNKKPNTAGLYRSAMKLYLEYTKMTPKQLIKEASDDFVKAPMDRENLVEERLSGFFEWIKKKEYKPDRTYSPKWANTCVGALMGFYRTFNYRVDSKKTGIKESLPKNARFNWTVKDIRKILNHAKCLRDRAVILCLFQSGMDDSTLCSLNFEDVKRELGEEKTPLKLDLKRKKESLPYITFLAPDAVNVLTAYIEERKRKEKRSDFGNDEPLFVIEGWARKKMSRVKPRTIQAVFRSLALEANLVDKEQFKKSHWNPARAHALRSAFMSLLRSRGLNEQDINFFVGHKIPYQQAYYQSEGERLRKTYADAMGVLSVYETRETITEIEERFNDKIKEQGTIISNLASVNKELKEKSKELEERFDRLDKFVKKWVKPAMVEEDVRELDREEPHP